MNARADWADVAERQYLGRVRDEDREQEAFDEARAEVCTELRALFVRAFNGEAVTFPCGIYVNKTCDLKEVISDALCSPSAAPMRALIEWQLPGCDEVFCRGTFREAVIDYYIDDVADTMANARVGK